MGVAPERSVTFIDNHDTGYAPGGQGLWPFLGANVTSGYAYILTHPGRIKGDDDGKGYTLRLESFVEGETIYFVFSLKQPSTGHPQTCPWRMQLCPCPLKSI